MIVAVPPPNVEFPYRAKTEASPLTEPKPGKGGGRGITLTTAGRTLFEQLTIARDAVDEAAQTVSNPFHGEFTSL